MFKNRCYKGGNKHKFEPRCEEKCNDTFSRRVIEMKDSRDFLYYNIYIHDICVWCGKIIKK